MTAEFAHEPDTRTRVHGDPRCAHCLQLLVVRAGKLKKCCEMPRRGPGLRCHKCGRPPAKCSLVCTPATTPQGVEVVPMWME